VTGETDEHLMEASELGGVVAPWEVCDKCGAVFGIGASPFCRDNHTPVPAYFPFTHYFDIGLGCEVTSWAQRRRVMKGLHMDFRDKMKPGDLSARLDRIHEQKKRQAEC
jgi:hypothetical protein